MSCVTLPVDLLLQIKTYIDASQIDTVFAAINIKVFDESFFFFGIPFERISLISFFWQTHAIRFELSKCV